jgi:hypothetical protein
MHRSLSSVLFHVPGIWLRTQSYFQILLTRMLRQVHLQSWMQDGDSPVLDPLDRHTKITTGTGQVSVILTPITLCWVIAYSIESGF